MTYGKVFSLLRKQSIEDWNLYTNHKFVKKLANNTLEKKVFLDYLIQDYLFLYQFSKAWSLAIVKADTLDEMKLCANTVNELINFEMNLHEKFVYLTVLLRLIYRTPKKKIKTLPTLDMS